MKHAVVSYSFALSSYVVRFHDTMVLRPHILHQPLIKLSLRLAVAMSDTIWEVYLTGSRLSFVCGRFVRLCSIQLHHHVWNSSNHRGPAEGLILLN